MEDDHGTHVLEGGGEPQLTDEARPVAELLERGVSHPGQSDTASTSGTTIPTIANADHESGSSATPSELRGG